MLEKYFLCQLDILSEYEDFGPLFPTLMVDVIHTQALVYLCLR